MIKVQSFPRKHGLQFLGSGSDRRVYALSDKYVLKMAKTKRGILQNKNECRISQMPEATEFAKVVARSKGYKYIVMERAEPCLVPTVNSRNEKCEVYEFTEFVVVDTVPPYPAYRWWKVFNLYEVGLGMINGREVIIDYGMTCDTPWDP